MRRDNVVITQDLVGIYRKTKKLIPLSKIILSWLWQCPISFWPIALIMPGLL